MEDANYRLSGGQADVRYGRGRTAHRLTTDFAALGISSAAIKQSAQYRSITKDVLRGDQFGACLRLQGQFARFGRGDLNS
jgi:hypothetical protein